MRDTYIFGEDKADKVDELRGPLLRVAEGGGVAVEDGHHGVHGVGDLRVRRQTLGHLDGSDAEGPDVAGGVVALSTNDLRSHPVGRTDEAATGLLLGDEKARRRRTSLVSTAAPPKSPMIT